MPLVIAIGPDIHAALRLHNRGAGVLATGELHSSGDVGILKEFKCDETVVGGGVGVVKDRSERCRVRGAEQVGDVGHGGCSEEAEGFRIDV
jgi:hypothetical protein